LHLIIFVSPNAKIDYWQLNLPAGYTCPHADKCLAKADKVTGKIKERKKGHDEFRCYAASQEALYPKLRSSRHNNFDLLLSKRTPEAMVHLIINSIDAILPRSARIFRIHSDGDFYNQNYFDAWLEVARHYPDIHFYAYTKSLPFWVNRFKEIPKNFDLTASFGGTRDDLIDKYNLKFAAVVFSEEEAANYILSPYWQKKLGREKGLVIDHDDSNAFHHHSPFALLLHGIQQKGSHAAEKYKALGGQGGKSSYGTNSRKGKNFND
jgi:hypothetical protein